MSVATSRVSRPFHVLTKPVGPICNLDCKYCFYLEKENLYPAERTWKMPEDVLEEYIRQYISGQPIEQVHFAWQGGEPTLLGVDFFRKVVQLQKKHAQGREISNALQTNGTLLDDEWCEFLTENQFLIGLSIDGPRDLHDTWRVDKQQKPTFDSVMKGLAFLKKHHTNFNTLTVVNRTNSQQPLAVYKFLKEIESEFLQFIPLVERSAQSKKPADSHPQAFASPDDSGVPVTEWSVEPTQYGRFLCDIFDDWIRRDVGTTFVQLFDVALGNWMGLGSSLCVFAEKCGAAMAIEHNGDLYSCDHYVYPRYKLGNIMNQTLGQMLDSPAQKKFGNDKLATLPKYCRECEVRFACNGECPKHRFTKTLDGEDGLNYLCPAYKVFFNHIDRPMRTMAQLLQNGHAAGEIMKLFKD